MFKIFSLVLLCLFSLAADATEIQGDLPDHFSVKQIPNCYQCVALLEDNTVIASLYPSQQTNGVFFLFDKDNQKKVILDRVETKKDYSAREVRVEFKVFTLNGKKISRASNFELSYPMTNATAYNGGGFDRFLLHLPLAKPSEGYGSAFSIRSKQATGYFGSLTYFRLCQGGDWNPSNIQELGYITRSLLAQNLDSELYLQNKEALRNVLPNPYIFYATLAMYSNTEYSYAVNKREVPKYAQPADIETINQLKNKLSSLATEQQLSLEVDMYFNVSLNADGETETSIPSWVNQGMVKLKNAYQKTYGSNLYDTSFLTKEEYLEQITDCAYNLVQSQTIKDNETARAILQYAIMTLNSYIDYE